MFERKRVVVAALILGIVLVLVVSSVALAEPPTRTIKLADQAGFGSKGQIIMQYNPNAPNAFVQFTVNGVPSLWGGDAWSLYLSTPSIGRKRIMTFNTYGAFPHDQHTGVAFLQDPMNPAWFEETVTAEIYHERDDGMDAPDVGGFLILAGSD